MKQLLVAIATMFSVLAGAAPATEPAGLRLMTYNIRLDLASDGVNAWTNRSHWVAAQVLWLRPDIFGMQEVLPNQKADLAAELPQYRLFGGGRDDGKEKGEASPVGYDKSRFDFLAGGMFWLSPTPEVPSKGWDAAYPRIVTWVRLRMRSTRQVVLAVNTHWDHIGVVARQQSAAQMLRWVEANARRCEKVLVFGDFNSEIDSEQMRVMTQGPLELRDARAVSKSAPFGPTGTFNEFKTSPTESRVIDHILLGSRIDVERYAVFSQVIEGRVPSDHFPVLVDLSLAHCR
ncbi:MAG TPA: endonuclease/exonuclease/phosphatase family protein [Steroidobacteraceae bacterium]|nr:endonuclease/exonuclease/phosphatase family protein [Steroidobacteraceae bacterium]